MYAKCGSMTDAGRVFSRAARLDVVSWNSLILGYAENGEEETALEIFTTIFATCCAPTALSFVAALTACISLAAKEEARVIDGGKLAKIRCLERGMAVHAQALELGLDTEYYVASKLVTLYAKSGTLADAWRVFTTMPSYNLVSSTALMQACVDNEEPELALEIYALCHNHRELRGLQSRDAGVLVTALKACGDLAALNAGRQVHADACRSGVEENPTLHSCLVDFYGKCGSMVDSQVFFDSLVTRDLITWTVLIAGYSRLGSSSQVFEDFGRMKDEGFQADAATLCCIIAACSCSGLIEKGNKLFNAAVYETVPDQNLYHSAISMLGRANLFQEAIGLVEKMPFTPTSRTWTTLLGICSKWNNIEVARFAFGKFLELEDRGDSSAYILMANIFRRGNH
ncbi:pentatricopeptide repeat-containing protein At5g16860-like [Selaginella moellendorffii]|uniref:pentatricopeptide repeat-containing protein At5g16860-like n=1 Tax=Selaginella moellendorffii TaxID=88036 RepID=UPI000D1CC564|nr:pentatricopeptide repeat-containing protein At5g16860-like [Selaginella moellendorffii]|eukprot:XP_024515473.1 pentatricopeptide repeat-containing protein At5g16860-like [Selaginella moellendorffii]